MENVGENLERAEALLKDSPEEAFRLYAEAVETKDPEAMYRYGKCLFEGMGCQKNVDKALSVLNDAHRLGNVSARAKLMSYYKDQVNNIGRYLDILKEGAKDGDVHCQALLAQFMSEKHADFEPDLEWAGSLVDKVRNGGKYESLTTEEKDVLFAVEKKVATLGERKRLNVMFSVAVIAWSVSVLILFFLGLMGVIIWGLTFGSFTAWARNRYEKFVMTTANMGKARTLFYVAAAVCAVFLLWLVASLYLLFTR